MKKVLEANIDTNSSSVGQKVKDKNRKKNSHNQENLSSPSHCTTSTSCVRLLRQRLKVKIGAPCGKVSKTGRRKVPETKKSVIATMKALSPAIRTSALDVSLTPKTKSCCRISQSHYWPWHWIVQNFGTMSR